MLYGAPGTGKTLLARALARHTDAKTIALFGADIRSKYVGDGEKKISRIFAFARKNYPFMIFIDEADALFRSRSSDTISRGHLEDINHFLITALPLAVAIILSLLQRPTDHSTSTRESYAVWESESLLIFRTLPLGSKS